MLIKFSRYADHYHLRSIADRCSSLGSFNPHILIFLDRYIIDSDLSYLPFTALC